MGNLIENRIISDLQKARTGRYEDNAENRRLHRVGQPYGSKDNGGNEQKGDNSDAEEITARVDRVLDVLAKRHKASKEDLKVFVREKIKNADYEDENLPYDITDNLDKMVRHLSETSAGKKVAASIKKEKSAGKKPSETKESKKAKGSDKYDEATAKGTKQNEDRQKRLAAKVKEGYVPVGGGDIGKVVEVKSNGSLKVSFYDGDEEWTNTVDKGSQVYTALKDSGKVKEPSNKNKDEDGDNRVNTAAKKRTADTEEVETYTRVKFEDIPNSGKVNLKKYLSEKMKKSADEAWGDVSKIDTGGLKKMEKGLVEDFNRQFDDLPKSRRAEKLYAIMKVKNELAKRGSDSKKSEEKAGDNSSASIYEKLSAQDRKEIPESFMKMSVKELEEVKKRHDKIKDNRMESSPRRANAREISRQVQTLLDAHKSSEKAPEAKEESIYAKELRLKDEISGMEIQHRIKEQANSWDHDNDERVLFRRKMNEKNRELAEVKKQIAKEAKK